MAQALEHVVAEVVEAARRRLDLRRVILFGSRARGDARGNSDLDLAFEHGSTDAEWAAFVNQMRDEASTLLSLDLVDLAQVDSGLRARITSEGRRVHG